MVGYLVAENTMNDIYFNLLLTYSLLLFTCVHATGTTAGTNKAILARNGTKIMRQ